MKGKAESMPTNHVVWANGFKSNMPDWPTARRVACSDSLLWWCREARTVLLTLDRPGAVVFTSEYDGQKFRNTVEGLQEVLSYADLGITPEDPLFDKFKEISTAVSPSASKGQTAREAWVLKQETGRVSDTVSTSATDGLKTRRPVETPTPPLRPMPPPPGVPKPPGVK